ncbi:hypothetical protein EDD16DRAFT_1706470 [Pisolithus croceorrhizus]|nr:hypothetical protein EDD16DRAFT_1706470 [Pisolithus croceorrhizus]
MTPQEQCALEVMHEGQENFFHAKTDNAYDITSILDGSKVIDLSHTGSKLCDLARDLFEDVKNMSNITPTLLAYSAFPLTPTVVHNNEHEVYLNLTMMIFNYRQALHIIQEGKNTLPCLMDDLGIMDVSVFSAWLLEENKYLAACLHEPKEEMLQMEYWQKLVNLDASQKHLSDLAWAVATPVSTRASSFIQRDIAATMQKEMM